MHQHSAQSLLYAHRKFKENPRAEFKVPWDSWEAWTWADWRAWFRRCLNAKIDRDDNRRWRKLSPEYQRDLALDRRRVEDYLFRRVRHTGSRGLLRTAEMKARYPHIDCQPWED